MLNLPLGRCNFVAHTAQCVRKLTKLILFLHSCPPLADQSPPYLKILYDTTFTADSKFILRLIYTRLLLLLFFFLFLQTLAETIVL